MVGSGMLTISFILQGRECTSCTPRRSWLTPAQRVILHVLQLLQAVEWPLPLLPLLSFMPLQLKL